MFRASLLALCLVGCGHRIADPGPMARPEIGGTPSPSLKVCWVEFAQGTLPHGLVVAHRALRKDVVSTQSGLLLQQGSNTWLVDGGMGLDVASELAEVHGIKRLAMKQAASGWTRTGTPASALAALGVDPATLTGLIPTHGHFDHLGGLLTVPDVPVVLPQAEIDLANKVVAGEDVAILPPEARALLPRAKALAFDGGPFLYWEYSHDLFGDGSVVLVPMPGHTAGSLGVHVRLPDGRALMLVGDTVWVREGYEQREPKGWIAANFDADGPANDEQIAKLWSLHQTQPALAILPAHDRRSWVDAFGAPGCVGAP